MFSGRQSCKGVEVLWHFRDWRQGQSQSLKRWRTSTAWQVCLPKNILLNSVTMEASRFICH